RLRDRGGQGDTVLLRARGTSGGAVLNGEIRTAATCDLRAGSTRRSQVAAVRISPLLQRLYDVPPVVRRDRGGEDVLVPRHAAVRLLLRRVGVADEAAGVAGEILRGLGGVVDLPGRPPLDDPEARRRPRGDHLVDERDVLGRVQAVDERDE